MRKSSWFVAVIVFLFLSGIVFLEALEVIPPEELTDEVICDLVYEYFGEDVKRAEGFSVGDVVNLTMIINNVSDALVSNAMVFSFVVEFDEKCVNGAKGFFSGYEGGGSLFQGAYLGERELDIAYLIASGVVIFLLVIVLVYFLFRKRRKKV